MKIREAVTAALFASVMMIALPGCEDEGPVEDTGEEIEDTFEDAGDSIDDATDD